MGWVCSTIHLLGSTCASRRVHVMSNVCTIYNTVCTTHLHVHVCTSTTNCHCHLSLLVTQQFMIHTPISFLSFPGTWLLCTPITLRLPLVVHTHFLFFLLYCTSISTSTSTFTLEDQCTEAFSNYTNILEWWQRLQWRQAVRQTPPLWRLNRDKTNRRSTP